MVRILFHPYAVDVYDSKGDFIGGITKHRMDHREAPYMVADALQSILKALGVDAEMVDDQRAANAERTGT